MLKKIILLSLSFLILFSCEKEEIELFKDGNEIYFDKFYMDELFPGTNGADSTTTSFFFYPEGTQQINVPVIVCLSGRALKEDQKFKLKVIGKEDANEALGDLYTTANSDEYTIDDEYVFHANNFGSDAKRILDTINIKINKSSRLEEHPEGYRLVVEMVPTGIIGLGQYERRRTIIHFSTNPAKPAWWDYEVEKNLLGTYSTKKYKLFLAHADTESRVNKQLIEDHPDEVIKLVMTFKEWLLRQTPQILDEDGEVMTVNV